MFATKSTKKRSKTSPKNLQFDLKELKILLKSKLVSCRRGEGEVTTIKEVTYKGEVLQLYKESCRYIYKIGEDFILKVELECEHQTSNEIGFYKNRLKKVDRDNFPRLIAGDKERGIVVQEFIPHRSGSRSQAHRERIEQLALKYNLDADINSQENYNWCINKKTGKPVIFDLGFA